MTTPAEPERMGARVVDRDGDTWRKGRTRWSCEAPVDGRRVTSVGRLGWGDLVSRYGPLRVLDLADRPAAPSGPNLSSADRAELAAELRRLRNLRR